MPIRSDIYNCTFKKANKVSIIITIIIIIISNNNLMNKPLKFILFSFCFYHFRHQAMASTPLLRRATQRTVAEEPAMTRPYMSIKCLLLNYTWMGDFWNCKSGCLDGWISGWCCCCFFWQCTFRSLELLSKRRYKICIRSVILEELKSFRNYEGFTIIFPKILDAI